MTRPKAHPKQESPGGGLVRFQEHHPPVGLPHCRDPFCYSNSRYGCLLRGCRLRARMEKAFPPLLLVLILLVLPCAAQPYADVAAIAGDFASTHHYALYSYNCDDMSITLANTYLFHGYNATLFLGNFSMNVTVPQDSNHVWVMVQVQGQWFAVESETGEVILTNTRYYNGWAIKVQDYWGFLWAHYWKDDPVPMQSFPTPDPMEFMKRNPPPP